MAIGRRAHLGMALVCGSCKQRFHSACEMQRHRAAALCKDEERYGCPHCTKDFGNRQILRLHMKVHEEAYTPPPQPISRPAESSEESAAPGLSKSLQTRLAAGNAASKKVGFTKIKFEDCLRCDECSCIYIHEIDYLKHMRNFHRLDSQRKKPRKGCRACCRQCNCRKGPPAPALSVETDRGNNNLFHFNIKDRWSKVVSRRLVDRLQSGCKDEPMDEEDEEEEEVVVGVTGVDLSHLLSQVEVKIKTEPQDPEELGPPPCNDLDFPPLINEIKAEPTN